MEYYAPAQRGSDLSAGVLLPSVAHENWPIEHAVGSAAIPGADTGLQEGMWQLNLQNTEGMEPSPGPYPERPGELDCVYYMRTGRCSFGMSCRFNHPPNRKLASAIARGRGEYPERVGQPDCQYYLKTGTCKFGATCKYHHPRDKGGQSGRAQVNILGLPLRSGEKECAYYIRTGSCKYGVTCKFHHPQPAPAPAFMPSLYAPAGSPSDSVAQHYQAGLSTWPITRGPYLPSPRLQPPNYAPLIIPPQGMVPIPAWSTYPGPVAPVTPDGQQPTLGPGYIYRGAHQTEPLNAGVHGSFGSYSPVSGAIGVSSLQSPPKGQKDLLYPERPGQQECQYYMKTGDCKFGATCRYHHPKDRTIPSATCGLSQMGLPLRPGAPACNYYIRYGICKFGPTCKFDHPLGGLSSSPSASSLTELVNVAYPVASTNASVLSSSASPESSLESIRPIPVSSKDSASVSGEPVAHDQLALKKGFEKADGNINSSREFGANSLQIGPSLPVHMPTAGTMIPLLGSES